jgi:hypothetical protein
MSYALSFRTVAEDVYIGIETDTNALEVVIGPTQAGELMAKLAAHLYGEQPIAATRWVAGLDETVRPVAMKWFVNNNASKGGG